MKLALVADIRPPLHVAVTFAVAVAVDPPGTYCTLTVQLAPAARTVLAVQVPPLIMEKAPPAVPTFATVGSELKVIEPVPTLLTVTRPVLVAVPLGPPFVNAGVGPVNDTANAVTLNSEVQGGPMGLVPAGVVMSTQWPPIEEVVGTVNVAVAVVAFTTTTLVMTGPFEPGWNMVAGAAKFVPVTVTVRVSPRAPELGLNELIVGGGAPEPLSATGEPLTPTLAVIVAVPVNAVADVGVNTILIVQFAPGVKLPAQVPAAAPPGRENGGVTATVMPVAAAPPVFARVRVRAALVLPTPVLGKLNEVGVTRSIATLDADWNSTAPTSKKRGLPPSGRGFPKKSVLGCVCATGT